MTDLNIGDEITVGGVFDDHLLTKPSVFLVHDNTDVNRISLDNADPEMRGRLPYYDESQNTVKNGPHPFPNGYPGDHKRRWFYDRWDRSK